MVYFDDFVVNFGHFGSHDAQIVGLVLDLSVEAALIVLKATQSATRHRSIVSLGR